MNKVISFCFLFAVIVTAGIPAFAHDPHHVEHNMLLFGETEIFASHIVYKVPHNFQVILKLELPANIRELYLRERKLHPTETFIYFLDRMHIGDIGQASAIAGNIFRKNDAGEKVYLARDVRLPRESFAIVYFNELPESLAPRP